MKQHPSSRLYVGSVALLAVLSLVGCGAEATGAASASPGKAAGETALPKKASKDEDDRASAASPKATAAAETTAPAPAPAAASASDAKARPPRAASREPVFLETSSEPTSTFGVDVDTASYTRVRASLKAGVIPQPKDVRVEEMVNYFRYSYPAPQSAAFGFMTDTARAPWEPGNRLVRIGIKGREVANSQRPPANIVLLIDASGSMAGPDKLDLLRDGFSLLAERLDERDTVAIVAYAGSAGVVLPPTRGDRKAVIINALDSFKAGGATNGSQGIQTGYELAAESFINGGINRVILATDGDFNLGATAYSELESLIERKSRTGIFLSVLGFGKFNPNDKRLELLADKGNGHYAFIDSKAESRRVLVDDLAGTLQTIAKDVKVQVRWNPAAVQSYRLLGYENRALTSTDFTDDSKDAGDIGAGHTVTAFYEVKPVSQRNSELSFGTVAIRYKAPDSSASTPIEVNLSGSDTSAADMSTDFRFAASVAAFGLALRSTTDRNNLPFDQIERLASGALGDDADGQRAEFVTLVRKASQRYQAATRAVRPAPERRP